MNVFFPIFFTGSVKIKLIFLLYKCKIFVFNILCALMNTYQPHDVGGGDKSLYKWQQGKL